MVAVEDLAAMVKIPSLAAAMNFFNWELWELIKNDLNSLWAADWFVVQFKQAHFVGMAATILVAALFFKIGWRWFRGRRTGYYEHSGYLIKSVNKPGLAYTIFGLVSWALLAGGEMGVLAAIADPYMIHITVNKIEQFQEVVYLKDTSTSMGWRYKTTNQARAEIAQEFFLRLVAARQGKKDRSCYLIFAYKPRLIADFTTDQQSLFFSAAVGPLVTTDEDTPKMWPDKFIIKNFDPIPFEGGTDLAAGLRAVIKMFDEKGDKKITEAIKNAPNLKRRSVIIITDGASEKDPEVQLKELQKRSIVPYLIFIEPDREAEIRLHGENSYQVKSIDILLRQVRRFGGESFLATDQQALDRIREKLDQLYGLNALTKVSVFEQHIYRWPLTAALCFLVLGLAARLILWKFHQVV